MTTTDWLAAAEAVCGLCGGRCCTDDTQPPVSPPCHKRLLGAGIPDESFEFAGYRRLRLNGHACILFEGGRCRFHGVKPETCRAGPFTFDIENGSIRLFLKREKICPLVRILKENEEAYRQQYDLAVQSIRNLVQNMPSAELSEVCKVDEPETEYVSSVPRREGP